MMTEGKKAFDLPWSCPYEHREPILSLSGQMGIYGFEIVLIIEYNGSYDREKKDRFTAGTIPF